MVVALLFLAVGAGYRASSSELTLAGWNSVLAQTQSEASEAKSPPSAPKKKARIAFERMDRFTRAKVLAALAGLIILGFAMVALTWLGARVTRRYMNQEPLRRRKIDDDDWAK